MKLVAPIVKSGKKWKKKHAVKQAEAALRFHGPCSVWACWLRVGHWVPMWSKASVVEKRKMVVEEIHRQEEIVRCTIKNR